LIFRLKCQKMDMRFVAHNVKTSYRSESLKDICTRIIKV
jgi:hypothetical protein